MKAVTGDSSGWVPVLTIVAGAVMAVSGLLLIGFYLHSVVVSLGQPDRSAIFWFLPIAMIGVALVAGGGALVALGVRARGGNGGTRVRARNGLAIAVFVAVVVPAVLHFQERSADEQRRAMDAAETLLAQRQAGMRQVETLDLAGHYGGEAIAASEGFVLQARISGGLDGVYRWELELDDSLGRTLLTRIDTRSLEGAATILRQPIAWSELFAPCFAQGEAFRPAFCAPGFEVISIIAVQARLMLLEDEDGPVAGIRDAAVLTFGKEMKFALHTVASEQQVTAHSLEARD
jgi:hypothetical protein